MQGEGLDPVASYWIASYKDQTVRATEQDVVGLRR